MKKKLFSALSLLLILLLAAACAAPAPSPDAPALDTDGISAEETPQAEIPAGEEATAAEPSSSLLGSFSATTLSGETVDESLLAGHRLTMINVWATYCGYCIDEMPALAELNRSYDPAFQVVGLVTDVLGRDGTPDPSYAALAENIIAETGASYPHLLPSNDLAPLLNQISVVPTTLFLDANGALIGSPITGARSKQEWTALIDMLMASLPETSEEAAVKNALPLSADAEEDPLPYDTEFPFYTFSVQDLNGQEVTDKLTAERDFTVLLSWDPADPASAKALQNAEQFQKDNNWITVLGAVLNAGDGESARALAGENAPSLTQILPLENMLPLLKAGEVLILVPWGDVGAEPFAAAEPLAVWQETLNSTEAAVYGEGCCG